MGLSESAVSAILEYDRRREVAWRYLVDSCLAPLKNFVMVNRERLAGEVRVRSDTGERVEVIRLPLLSPAGGHLYLDSDPERFPLLETSGDSSGPLVPVSQYDLAQLLDNPRAFRNAIQRLDERCAGTDRTGN